MLKKITVFDKKIIHSRIKKKQEKLSFFLVPPANDTCYVLPMSVITFPTTTRSSVIHFVSISTIELFVI